MLIGHSFQTPAVHFILELLAYFVAARVYWREARGQPMPGKLDRWLILASAIFGAFVGSKLLHVLEHLPFLMEQNRWDLWLGGKSLLGGLMGGTLGVEIAKRSVNWRQPTGDAWVPALAVGIIIGRLGCQFSGLWDQTFGSESDLGWGWDYGDGVPRHPVALYEIAWVLVAWALTQIQEIRDRRGAGFALFLFIYCLARFILESMKPPFGGPVLITLPVEAWWGFTAIQWAALAGMIWFWLLLRLRWRQAR